MESTSHLFLLKRSSPKNFFYFEIILLSTQLISNWISYYTIQEVIMLFILNQTCAASLSENEITCAITP